MKGLIRFGLTLSVGALVFSACHGDTTRPVAVATVTIVTTPDSPFYTNRAQVFFATVMDARGTALLGRTVLWSSDNPAVASVDDRGKVIAHAAGSVSITATCEGKSDRIAVTVTLSPVLYVYVRPEALSIVQGTTYPLAAEVRDNTGTVVTGRPVTWASSDPTVATVSTAGLVTGVAFGTSTITVTSETKSAQAIVSVVLPPRAFLWTPTGGLEDLGTLPGGNASDATAINDAGQVVGSSETASGARHAFVWTRGVGMVDLGTLPGKRSSVASAINAAGQIVGQSSNSSNDSHAFLRNPGGDLVDLGTLPDASSSVATGINARGEVVGYSEKPSRFLHAFRWTPASGMQDLGSSSRVTASYAYAINDSGSIVGSDESTYYYCVYFGGCSRLAVRWPSSGGMVTLTGLCAGSLSSDRAAYAINAPGQIVGSCGKPFLWTATGGMTALTLLPGASVGDARGINDLGQIVGGNLVGSNLARNNYHAVRWTTGGSPADLGVLPGRISSTALGINRSGAVVGWSW